MSWILRRYFPEWAAIALRVALGAVFMTHGWDKLTGPLGTPLGFNIESWGWPYPVVWAWGVALIEFFGGLLIIVGLLTRFAAAFIAGVMGVAILKVKFASGFVGGFELDFALLMIAIALVFCGGGRVSVDRDVLGWGAPPLRSRVGETPYD
ncbi:MAG: DoxX family protein [Gemmatimonadota bacterium]|nr:MAG: DoxX family protein [Gemmatimonadota bacterium]